MADFVGIPTVGGLSLLHLQSAPFTAFPRNRAHWYTTFGEIEIFETSFLLKNHLVRPFSAATDITSRGYSLTLQRRIADFGADDSFGKVPWKLKEHYGIHIPLHSPRTITEKHAGIIKEMEIVTDILPVLVKDFHKIFTDTERYR